MVKIAEKKFLFIVENVATQVYHVDTGYGLPKHEHDQAHATVCYAGSIKITKDKKEFILNKNSQPVLLKENEWHEIEALEDGTVFCNVISYKN